MDLSIAGDTPTWTLQDRLRKAREHRGLQQSELAQLTEISIRSIQNYEAGRTTPKRPQLIAWAMATGVALDWIVNDVVRPKGLEPLTFWVVLWRALHAWRCRLPDPDRAIQPATGAVPIGRDLGCTWLPGRDGVGSVDRCPRCRVHAGEQRYGGLCVHCWAEQGEGLVLAA